MNETLSEENRIKQSYHRFQMFDNELATRDKHDSNYGGSGWLYADNLEDAKAKYLEQIEAGIKNGSYSKDTKFLLVDRWFFEIYEVEIVPQTVRYKSNV